jgi:hypothetical protein
MIQWTDLQALTVAEGWQVLIWLELEAETSLSIFFPSTGHSGTVIGFTKCVHQFKCCFELLVTLDSWFITFVTSFRAHPICMFFPRQNEV